MPPVLSIEQVVDQITLCNHESAMSGRWLFGELSSLMDLLKSGRSPRTLGLATRLDESEQLLNVFDQVLTEWRDCLPELKARVAKLSSAKPEEAGPLMQSVPEIEREFAFWLGFGDRARALLKKFRLIADEEKLSGLGRAPLFDVWDELERMSRGA